MAKRPEAELPITVELVRSLLVAQAPDLAELSLTELSRGWDNTNYRLGDDLLVRVPHRAVAAPLIDHEQRWLPLLAERIDLPIPAPVVCGAATTDFPWPWTVAPYFTGSDAALVELSAPAATAEALGRFFAQLHQDAPDDAPQNPYRGVALSRRRDPFISHLAKVSAEFDHTAMTEVFDASADAPATTERVWLHGDLHGRNMVVNDSGQLAAVIDWGDICSGDRATDLAGAFMLVPEHLDIVQRHADADDAAWNRARGWAMNFAAIYLANSDDAPVMNRIGRRLLSTLLDS